MSESRTHLQSIFPLMYVIAVPTFPRNLHIPRENRPVLDVRLLRTFRVPGVISLRVPCFQVTNALQTNGTLLDRRWAEFLKAHNFLVGISLDGPKGIHDHYRRDEKKIGTHSRVMRNLQILLDEGVEVNILTLLNEYNVREPERVFEFLLSTGVKFFQFVPCVEPGPIGSPAFYSISPADYGGFLCKTFDLWLDSPMDISVRDFDDFLAWHKGDHTSTCIFQPRCGGYLLVEHTGDVYPCDFFVTPKS